MMSYIKTITGICLFGVLVGGTIKFFNNNPTNNEVILLMIIIAMNILNDLRK